MSNLPTRTRIGAYLRHGRIAIQSGFTWQDHYWAVAFWLILAARFLLPLYEHPMFRLESDMLRHWNNGVHFWHPGLWGAIDTKLYQLYLALVIALGKGSQAPIGLYSGLLCAAMPYVWYRAARELYGKSVGLKLGICLGLCPSFLVIYEYFMTETLMLVMLGLSLWLTLRGLRKQTRKALMLAGMVNALSCYTRLILLPVNLALVVFLLFRTSHPRALAVSAFGIFGLCYLLSGLHSFKVIDKFTALGDPAINAFYHYSGAQSFQIIMKDGYYSLRSPSFVYNLWSPFTEFRSCRREGAQKLYLDVPNISASVDYQLRSLKRIFTSKMFWCNWRENQLFLWFGNSWPDSSESLDMPLHYLNFHLRWLWAPLLLFVLLGGLFIRTRPQEMMIILCVMGMFLCLSLQQTAVMEGRYRKPMEPLMIFAAYAIASRLRRTEAMPDELSAWQLVRYGYVQPAMHMLHSFRRHDVRFPSFRRRS